MTYQELLEQLLLLNENQFQENVVLYNKHKDQYYLINRFIIRPSSKTVKHNQPVLQIGS